MEMAGMKNKMNTFTDFVACARHLVKAGWTATDRLVARGASANIVSHVEQAHGAWQPSGDFDGGFHFDQLARELTAA